MCQVERGKEEMNNNFIGISAKADTKPHKDIPKEEMKYHIARKSYRCLCCGQHVKEMTYHIHSFSINRKTPIHKGIQY